MLEKVIENWTSRLDYIRASRGSPMPEIIFKMQIILEVDSDDVQELLDFHNQELTTNKLIEMHGQDIEELESLDPFQSVDRMAVRNLKENLSLIEKGLQILENADFNEGHIFTTKQGR
ncbi:tigger transposable element-derived protein 1 [Trichonephila clavipes]|nr:tigger transposable element-derived protein 1 [Trichonephila clavipes]